MFTGKRCVFLCLLTLFFSNGRRTKSVQWMDSFERKALCIGLIPSFGPGQNLLLHCFLLMILNNNVIVQNCVALCCVHCPMQNEHFTVGSVWSIQLDSIRHPPPWPCRSSGRLSLLALLCILVQILVVQYIPAVSYPAILFCAHEQCAVAQVCNWICIGRLCTGQWAGCQGRSDTRVTSVQQLCTKRHCRWAKDFLVCSHCVTARNVIVMFLSSVQVYVIWYVYLTLYTVQPVRRFEDALQHTNGHGGAYMAS